jgi:membrane protein YqaA with SNARE-associated domain
MAAIGSVTGCSWIYALARKGGQAYYRNEQQQPSGRIRNWVQKYPFTSVLLPAIAPFPVPFKPFVIALGVFQVPFVPFVVGTFVGRGALVFMEGFLGVRLWGGGQGICSAPEIRFGCDARGPGCYFRGDSLAPGSAAI